MQNDALDYSKYACPRTHSALRLDGDVLRAASGGGAYAVQEGIPQFLHFAPAEDAQTKEQLERLVKLAREDGWRPALDAVYGADASIVRYVTQIERASYLELLPLTPRSEVLEIGPGLGQFTALLASRARSVHGLEVVADQARFAAERCRQEGRDNVHLAAGGDDCRLPYADGSFDLVVLNLVFEWCATRCVDESIADVQLRLLREICRVLKPGGSLYLATKNRFALRVLMGTPDDHCCGVRFGSALPRWLADRAVRRRGHARRAGLLHSHNGLRALLRQSGFERVESFWATPEFRFPKHYVPNDAAAIRAARRLPGFVQGEARSTRLVMPLVPAPLVRHFTPGLAFLATRPG